MLKHVKCTTKIILNVVMLFENGIMIMFVVNFKWNSEYVVAVIGVFDDFEWVSKVSWQYLHFNFKELT